MRGKADVIETRIAEAIPDQGDRPAADSALDPPPDRAPGRLERVRAQVASSASLTGVFVLLLLYTLHIASSVVVPVAVALLLTLLLSPPMRLITRIGVPVPVAAGLVVALFIGVLGSAFYGLSSPAADWIEQIPPNMKKLERKLAVLKGPIQEMTAATQQVEKLTSIEAPKNPATQSVEISQPGFLRLTLRSTPPALVSIAVTFVLLYFMLSSGREIMRKVARPRSKQWSRRRLIAIVRAVESDISRYLVTVSMINATLGAVTAVVLQLLDVPNALLWGVVVAVLNYAPYIGATTSTVLLALVGLLSFDSIGRALVVPAVFMGLAFIEGQILTPSIVGRRLSLSPLLVFLSVIVCGWMWGAIGALIAVPLLASIKIICQHVPQWTRVAEVIGR